MPCSGILGYEKQQSGYALCAVFLHHIFAVAGMLRIPLSQPQKRRQPRTLCEIGTNNLQIISLVDLKLEKSIIIMQWHD